MKKMRKITWMIVMLLLCGSLLIAPAAAEAAPPAAELPYIGDRAEMILSSAQAKAYAEVLQDFTAKLSEPRIYPDEATYNEGYAVLVGTGENTLLWLVNAHRYERNQGMPDLYPMQGRPKNYISISYEEIWEWDGEKAVRWEQLGSYVVNATLYDGGLLVYRPYGGTDLDGDCWSAFYPFADGHIAAEPEWCHAWSFLYGYKLGKDYDLWDGRATAEEAKAHIEACAEKYEWPKLAFDWDTVELIWDAQDRCTLMKVCSGTGFADFLAEHGIEPADEKFERFKPEYLTRRDEVLLAPDWLALQENPWMDANAVASLLSAYEAPEMQPQWGWVIAGAAVLCAAMLTVIFRIKRRQEK